MAIEIYPMQEGDIESAVTCIQQAFADDPYNKWIFDPATVNLLPISTSPLESS